MEFGTTSPCRSAQLCASLYAAVWQKSLMASLLSRLVALTVFCSWCSTLVPFPGVPQQLLRADLQRQFQSLLALGWLGRTYQVAPCLASWTKTKTAYHSSEVSTIFPKVFKLDPYNTSALVPEADGHLQCTFKESSILMRGLPFRLSLRVSHGVA